MSASALPTARPKATAIAWATKDSLYVEIPCKDSAPLIVRYRKTVDGLTAALNILIEHEAPAYRPPASHPKATRVPLGATSRAPWATDAQRAATRDILKKLKLT